MQDTDRDWKAEWHALYDSHIPDRERRIAKLEASLSSIRSLLSLAPNADVVEGVAALMRIAVENSWGCSAPSKFNHTYTHQGRTIRPKCGNRATLYRAGQFYCSEACANRAKETPVNA